MTIAEAVDYTGLPAETFRLLEALRIGPASFRLGRRRVYRTADIDEWRTNRSGSAELKAATATVIDALGHVDEVYAC